MEPDLISSPLSHSKPQPGALPHWFSLLHSCPVLEPPQPRALRYTPAGQNDTAESRASCISTFRPPPSSLVLLLKIWLDWANLGSTAKEHWAYSTRLASLALAKRMR